MKIIKVIIASIAIILATFGVAKAQYADPMILYYQMMQQQTVNKMLEAVSNVKSLKGSFLWSENTNSIYFLSNAN